MFHNSNGAMRQWGNEAMEFLQFHNASIEFSEFHELHQAIVELLEFHCPIASLPHCLIASYSSPHGD